MTSMKIVTLDAKEAHGTALIAQDDTVWVAIHMRWWDLSTIMWWWLCPSDRKGFAYLNLQDGRKVRTRVIRVAHRHVRIRGVPDPSPR